MHAQGGIPVFDSLNGQDRIPCIQVSYTPTRSPVHKDFVAARSPSVVSSAIADSIGYYDLGISEVVTAQDTALGPLVIARQDSTESAEGPHGLDGRGPVSRAV